MTLNAKLPTPMILSATMPDNLQTLSIYVQNVNNLNFVDPKSIVTNTGDAVLTNLGEYILYT